MNAELPDNSRRWMMSVKTIPLLKSSMAYTLANLLFLLGDSVVGTLVNFCPRRAIDKFLRVTEAGNYVSRRILERECGWIVVGSLFQCKEVRKNCVFLQGEEVFDYIRCAL